MVWTPFTSFSGFRSKTTKRAIARWSTNDRLTVLTVSQSALCATVPEIMNYPMGYSYPCPTIDVNTAAVHNSSAVSLFLLLVVVVTYVPASSAKRKRKAFQTIRKG